MAGLKRLFNRILLDPGDIVAVTTDEPVRTQEQLEDSVTYVAEFNVIERLEEKLTSNTPVQIDQIDWNDLDEDDGYSMRRVFTGVINHISGTSYPNQAKITATGVLARLRLTRLSDHDFSGDTDGEAVMWVLGQCGIPYDPDDIADYGYVLGAIKPVIWPKGTTAASFIQELDRVLGMATIEIGTGRVVRIPYSRVPYDYESSAIVKSFNRGNANVDFFENNRDRGDIEAIQNYWRVTGVSWDGEEGAADEGCNYTIWAEAKDAHPKLGAGVYIGPQEFSSDIIQSEALAKAIARRLIRWYNREPDTIRVVAMNDPRINVGDLIAVKDQAWGIDLTSGKRYLVLNIARDGHTMTIDGIGGTAGGIDTLVSGIDKCCGTQQEDGTCVDEGTDPDPTEPPDPGAPPDEPAGHCDPIEDPTCIPGVDYELPPAPNVDDPFINCEETDNLVDLIALPWRETGNTAWSYDSETDTTNGVYTLSTGVLIHNETVGAKSPDDDVLYGPETVCVSGVVRFCNYNGEAGVGALSPHITVSLQPVGAGSGADAAFYATPGRDGQTGTYGVFAGSENEAARDDPGAGIYTCVGAENNVNNGGMDGAGVEFDTDAAFSVCFDITHDVQEVFVDGDFGSAHMKDTGWTCDHLTPDPSDAPACSHAQHRLTISLLGSNTVLADSECPWVMLKEVIVGSGTCEENPNYFDPYEELDA